jgi:hypothetical protein
MTKYIRQVDLYNEYTCFFILKSNFASILLSQEKGKK